MSLNDRESAAHRLQEPPIDTPLCKACLRVCDCGANPCQGCSTCAAHRAEVEREFERGRLAGWEEARKEWNWNAETFGAIQDEVDLLKRAKQLEAEVERLQGELLDVDRILDRRDALADSPTRADKLLVLLRVAQANDPKGALAKAEAEVERLTQDGRLLHIAGLVNGYHNDDHALSAAETLREIANVLGPPMDARADRLSAEREQP